MSFHIQCGCRVTKKFHSLKLMNIFFSFPQGLDLRKGWERLFSDDALADKRVRRTDFAELEPRLGFRGRRGREWGERRSRSPALLMKGIDRWEQSILTHRFILYIKADCLLSMLTTKMSPVPCWTYLFHNDGENFHWQSRLVNLKHKTPSWLGWQKTSDLS